MTKLAYEGIKKRYPRTPLPEKIRGYFQLIRPFTLLPAFVVGIFGTLTALAYYNLVGFGLAWQFLPLIILASLSLMSTQAFGQVLNQIEDVHVDIINKPYRPIPSGIITENEAMGVAIAFFLTAALTAVFVNLIFLTLIIIGLFMGYAYNCEPLRLKKRLWINIIGLSFSRGLLPFLMMWSVIGLGLFDPTPWVLGGFVFLVVLFGQNFKDFPDIEGDEKYGMRTLPVIYGRSGALKILSILALLPFTYLFGAIGLGLLSSSFLLLCVLLPIFWVMFTYDEVELRWMENSLAWVLFYISLGLCYVLSFVAMLI